LLGVAWKLLLQQRVREPPHPDHAKGAPACNCMGNRSRSNGANGASLVGDRHGLMKRRRERFCKNRSHCAPRADPRVASDHQGKTRPMLVPRSPRRRRPQARTLSHDGRLLVSLRSRRGCDSSCPFRRISDLARFDRVRCSARGDPAACYSGQDPSTAEAGYSVIPIGKPDDSLPDWDQRIGRRVKLRDLRVLAEVARSGQHGAGCDAAGNFSAG
jgi:hypothetical protein